MSEHYIEFRNVYKTFDYPVLVDVNFHVDAGQTLAIIGRSGVGKSVSLGHIMGFLKPDAGRVVVSASIRSVTRGPSELGAAGNASRFDGSGRGLDICGCTSGWAERPSRSLCCGWSVTSVRQRT